MGVDRRLLAKHIQRGFSGGSYRFTGRLGTGHSWWRMDQPAGQRTGRLPLRGQPRRPGRLSWVASREVLLIVIVRDSRPLEPWLAPPQYIACSEAGGIFVTAQLTATRWLRRCRDAALLAARGLSYTLWLRRAAPNEGAASALWQTPVHPGLPIIEACSGSCLPHAPACGPQAIRATAPT